MSTKTLTFAGKEAEWNSIPLSSKQGNIRLTRSHVATQLNPSDYHNRFFNLLTHTAHLSKLRAIFEREKIIRALRALNEAYSRGIAHVHTFLPESHPLFQPPPSPRPS